MKTKMQVIVCPSCQCDEVEQCGVEVHDASNMRLQYGSEVSAAAAELIRRAGKKPGQSVTLYFMCRGCEEQYAVHYVTDGDQTLRILTAGVLD